MIAAREKASFEVGAPANQIHSIFLTNSDGMILYKRYYNNTIVDPITWEQQIFTITNPIWPLAKNEVHQCVSFEEKFIVFTYWGEILIMIVGSEEYDELALSDILDILADYFKENIIVKRPLQELTEQQLIQPEQYDKLCFGIDELISATGILDQTDVSKLNSQYKSKTFRTAKNTPTMERRGSSQPHLEPSTNTYLDHYIKRSLDGYNSPKNSF